MALPDTLSPTYPPTSDIGYVVWLKHFAFQLPPLAARYQITEKEVSAVQCIVAELAGWLMYHRLQTTQQVRLSQDAASTAFHFGPEPSAPHDIFLLDRIAALVSYIRTHPSYCPTDGSLLGIDQTGSQSTDSNKATNLIRAALEVAQASRNACSLR